MKKAFCLLLTFLCMLNLQAQKLDVTYFDHSNVVPASKNILFSYANKALIPFMIPGINPHDSKTNRVGVMDSTNRVIIKPLYSNCSYFIDGLAMVQDTTTRLKKGVINTKGRIIIPLIYDWVQRCANGLFFVRNNKEIALLDAAGKVIIPMGKYTGFATPWPVYVEGNDMSDERFYWGLLPFESSVQFEKHIGVNTGKKWAVINRNGEEIVPPKFDQIWPFENRLAPAKIGLKIGVINTEGNVIIPALYNKIVLTNKNFMYVTTGGKTGVLTIDNKLIIPMKYAYISAFADGFVAYDNNYNAVLFSGLGKPLSNSVYNPRLEFPIWGREGDFWVYNKARKQFNMYQDIRETKKNHTREKMFFFQKDNKWGLMDSTGVELTGALFNEVDDNTLNYFENNSQSLIIVKRSGKSGLIDFKGKLRLPMLYDKIATTNGEIIVINESKYGLLNNKFKFEALRYDSIVVTEVFTINGNNRKTSISARIGKEWGLINSKGKEITALKYDNPIWFFDDLALVKIDGKSGVINPRGKQVVDCKYDDIKFVADNVQIYYYNQNLVFKKAGLYGIMDLAGREITPAIYDRIIQLVQPFAKKYKVLYHGQTGLLDAISRKLIIPCEYDDIKVYGDRNGAEEYYDYSYPTVPPYLITNKQGSYGLIDSLGNERLPFIYDHIFFEKENVYFVRINRRQGLINKDLKVIIYPKYNFISLIHPGFYIAHNDKSMDLINTDGELITQEIQQFNFCGQQIIIKKNDMFGVIDFKGKVVVPFQTREITCSNEKSIIIGQ
jgi:hypothetical protein